MTNTEAKAALRSLKLDSGHRHDITTRIDDVNLADNIWAAKRQYRAVTCTYAQSPGHTQRQSHLGTAARTSALTRMDLICMQWELC